jgi:L-amino acid N-acyltransferase YncA
VNPGTPRAEGRATVRPALPADAGRMAEIYAGHVRHGTATFETEPPPAAEMARRLADVVGRGLPWLVAEVDGLIVGYAYAGPYRLRPAYRYTVENSVYLDPEWTGRGIGRMLMERVMAECERTGCRQMIAVIGDSANAASIRLHRSLGFRDIGVFRAVGWKLGRWLDTVLMQRELGPGAIKEPDEGGGMGL